MEHHWHNIIFPQNIKQTQKLIQNELKEGPKKKLNFGKMLQLQHHWNRSSVINHSTINNESFVEDFKENEMEFSVEEEGEVMDLCNITIA